MFYWCGNLPEKNPTIFVKLSSIKLLWSQSVTGAFPVPGEGDDDDKRYETIKIDTCISGGFPLSDTQNSTLTPMHLRKAKLMFFWVRYPSSAILKMYFPDIKFNKNNTAQLVKWFSNFR